MADESCPAHAGKAVRWHCGRCQAPLCEECGAVAFQASVYCRTCAAQQPSPTPTDSHAKSDVGLGRGIGLAFLITVLAGLIAGSTRSNVVLSWLVLYGGALVWAKRSGRGAMLRGLIIGFVIQIGLALLLLAACFGLIALLGGIHFGGSLK